MACGMLVLLTIAVAATFFDWSFGKVLAMIQSQFNFLPFTVIAVSCSLFYNLIFRLRASRSPVLSAFMMSAALWTGMGFSGIAATYAGNDLDHKVATARRLFLGDEIEQDRDEAYRLYRLAAERGHSEAKNGLGACYALGGGVERDNQKAVEWFRRAAEQGSGKGQLNLADSLWCGIGIERNSKNRLAAELRGY